ncbi:MAG: aromatic ring-hydroxylating dioxygenase subunit alpha [Microthrixaceae bacterium]|nr:aromatic ring-hydroxylating dioxygenase subunit alpha [Microthrixaceae bacterium]MCB1011301.1 aromatic ring-hydroxylating dioxygenase subunit alpha [Microthrixaceae bacterium]MCO5322919.1 aromatic ring-hydroxylating dioxygenase subunit alpha [Microthrixaceae bacterium]
MESARIDTATTPDLGPGPLQELTPLVHAAVREARGDLAEGTMVIPNANYTDPGIAARELATSFGAPLLVGPARMVERPGDWVTLTLVDTPVVVVRGDDDRVRVLLNACRHRGAQVADGAGCSRRLTCPYHAWSYDTSGALVGIPGAEGFADRDRASLGLVELPSEERAGFLWALRDPSGAIDLDAHLGPMEAELESWGLDYHVATTMELKLRSNWKCALEAFQETYHFPYVHSASLVGQGTISNIVTFHRFGRHHRLGVPLASMPTPLTDGEHVSCIYYLYPCTVMATSPVGAELLQFWPGATPSTSTVRHSVLSRQSVDEADVQAFYEGYAPLIQAVVRDEDVPVLESSGIGLAAGHTDAVLGRNEIGCQGAHRQILADLGEPAG